MKNDKNSVMVVGAGIGGCQAALNLAELGLKVYLVEKNPIIGDTKKELDKLYPLYDCSVCLHAPKLIGVEDNPNIELITTADIVRLEGKPGNFRVKIRKKSADSLEERCKACDECVYEAYSKAMLETEKDNLYPVFPEFLSLKVLLEHRKIPPCENECPAHVKAQEYNSLISKGDYKEALEVIRDRCPLPSVIGRICNHPCETVCNRVDLDESVNICGLKRFVADFVRENLDDEVIFLEEKKEKTVAIVGSGPSGLTVGYQLARKGYSVTIFERGAAAGGMLRFGVPDYRLPPEILDADIGHIKKYGVDIKTNSEISTLGKSIKELKKSYDAVYIGVGLQNSRKLNIEGEDLENIIYATDFLRSCALGEKVKVGKNTIVIGGGDVAIDVARSALRKGAEKVQLFMLESEDIIPAQPWEVEEAKEEGIIFNVSRGPKQFIGKNGKLVALETLICSSVFDEEGRFNPVLEECTEEVFEGDMAIVSIGQSGDLEFLDKEIKIGRGISVDNTFQTSMEGVFAAGEIAFGPGSAIKAIASANKAAFVIDKYLQGEDISKLQETIPDYEEDEIIRLEDMDGLDRVKKIPRTNIELLPVEKRITNFQDITIGMSEENALQEANRCLSCGICQECRENVKACVARSIYHEGNEDVNSINVASVMLSPGESWLLCYDLRKGTNYRWKILNPVAVVDEEKCISCGDCIDVCMFDAIDRIGTEIEFASVIDSINPSLSLLRYKSRVNSDACVGCGACVGTCPVGAISFKYFSNEQIAELVKMQIEGL